MARAWLSDSVRDMRPAFGQVAAVSAFVNLLAVAAPVFVLQVYDRVVMHAGLSTLYGLMVGVCIAILFDFVLRQYRARLLQRVALGIDIGVSSRLMDRLLAVPLRELEARPATYWEILFRDVHAVRNTFSGATAIAIADLPFAVIFLGVVYLIAPPMALVVLVLLPVFTGIAWWGARNQNAASEEEQAAVVGREAVVSDIVAGRTTIKSLGLDGSFRDRWETAHAATVDAGLERGRSADNFLNAGLAISIVSTVAITGVGALAILDQQITIGALIATNMLANRIIGPFHQLVGTWRTVASCKQALARLDTVFALPFERAESTLQFERPRGTLTFDAVVFRYRPEDEPVIDGLGLTLEAKGLYGVIGANGSGKTTLLKLAMGLYSPDDGRVLIDGADIAQFSRRDLSRWFGFVPQDVRLFNGTLRDNICAGSPDAPDADILTAARHAGLHDFVAALPNGYGTVVGDGGAGLPGGIRQKVAIARALVHDPVVVVLDEPSSNLDREAEAQLARTLRRLSADRTVVMATHSTLLLGACHSVLVLERGRIGRGGAAKDILPELFSAHGPTVPGRAQP
ncbi:MAG: peptidase domain-containing ABC transporter [Rhodospirillaceae bacterium]